MKTIKNAIAEFPEMIKKTLFLLGFLILTSACSSDDTTSANNPYLTDTSFRMDISLNLPEYQNLNFPGNSFSTYNYGLNGIVIYNINNTHYTAFELSDPNHPLSDCSRLTVEGIIASCNCEDGNSYNILTGELSAGSGQYSLKSYRVRKNGNFLEVYN